MSARDVLAGIKARAEDATAGPWAVEVSRYTTRVTHGTAYGMARLPMCEVNAEFIAAARSDVPRLVAAVEAVLAYADQCDAMSTTLEDGRTDGITVGLRVAAHDVRNKITAALEVS